MGKSVTISAAAEQDAEQIFRLQYLCFQSEAALYGNYRIDPLVQTLDSVREEVAGDCVFVARLGDEIVGSVHGRIAEDGAAAIGKLCVHPRLQGHGIGARIVRELLDEARRLGVQRVFVLTFEREFFARFGFVEIDGAPVPPAVYEQLLRSYDEGVAEFLGLDRVKPNILGNTRMLLHLDDAPSSGPGGRSDT